MVRSFQEAAQHLLISSLYMQTVIKASPSHRREPDAYRDPNKQNEPPVTRPCTLQTVLSRGAVWKRVEDAKNTLVFDPSDDATTNPAVLTIVGTVAQWNTELGPLGSYNPRYNRPSFNSLLYSSWMFELGVPEPADYLPAFRDGVQALSDLQRAVSESGRDTCLLHYTAPGVAPAVLFEQALFVKPVSAKS